MTDADPDEVERLRSELEALKQANAELQTGTASSPAPKHRWRVIASIALVVIASLLVPVSILGVWLRNNVTETDRYVATVSPLAKDPAVQAAVANRVTNALYENVDVPALVKDALPEKAAFLSGPISSGVRNVVHDLTLRLVESEQFATLWDSANRFAHEQVVDVLTAEHAPQGKVVIDLSGVAKAASAKLSSSGLPLFDKLPSDIGDKLKFEVFQSDEVARVQSSFKLFTRVATVLPWVAVLLLVAAVFVAPNRRRGVIWAATGLVLGAALVLVGLIVGRAIYLDALPSAASQAANEVFFDTLTRFVRSGTRTVVAVGLVILLVALIMGPSGPAVGIRRFFAKLTGRLGDEAGAHGADFGPVGHWVGRNLAALRIAVGVLAVLVLIIWSAPTAKVVLGVAIAAVLALAVVEVIGRAGQTSPQPTDTGPPEMPPPDLGPPEMPPTAPA